MSKEIIIFKKVKEYEDGSKLTVRFNGSIENGNVDREKIDKLIDDFIDKKRYHNDMVRNVEVVRTILNMAKERLLVIEYSDKLGKEEVLYEKGSLCFFQLQKRLEEKEIFVNAKFNFGKGLSVLFSDNMNNKLIGDSRNAKRMEGEFEEILEHINLLRDAKKIELNKDARVLIEIYKLFYQEDPDFSAPDINVKMQTMMAILAQFGVSLSSKYYSFNLGEQMPVSITIEHLLNELYPFGEVTDVVNVVRLPENKIKMIGEWVRNLIQYDSDKNEVLMTLSRIIYASRYSLLEKNNLEELSEVSHCSQVEVENSIRLVRRIEDSLKKENK